MSLAGWWYTLVSLPVLRFLIWRWIWRLLVWARLLWKVSRLNLRLVPTHPDGAGGLGPLGVATVDLSPLAFGTSAALAASYAEQIAFGGVPAPEEIALPAAGVVVGLTAFLLLPLGFFGRRLLEVKQRRGLLVHGALASGYVQAFHDKWLRGGAGADEVFLGSADVQSLADLGNSFGNVRNMQLVPISWRQITTLVLAAAIPMVPLVLFAVPLDQIVIGAVRSLFGL